jgi:hypothetical protein
MLSRPQCGGTFLLSEHGRAAGNPSSVPGAGTPVTALSPVPPVRSAFAAGSSICGIGYAHSVSSILPDDIWEVPHLWAKDWTGYIHESDIAASYRLD